MMLQLATDSKTAVEATRLYRATLERSRQEQELRIAARIQQALLPEGLCCGNNFDLAATSVPCRAIGGDFFDYLHLPGGLGFALGDVAGTGPAAALLASKLQGISDGVTEAFNGSDEEFGEARLLSCVMAHHQLPPQALLERILDNVHDFAAAAPQTDDLTIMVMRHRPMPVAGVA